jgi:transposase-like protein
MHWPRTPVERLRTFHPPFCPYRDCPQHLRQPSPDFRFRRHGFYSTARARRIPRFVCLTCRRSFSRQAFSVRYFLKRPELLEPIACALQAGSAHRQIARSLGCAHSTVTRLSARLGCHGLRGA